MIAGLVLYSLVSLMQVPNVVATFDGVFQSVDKKFLELKTDDGESMRMYTTRSTKYIRNGQPAKPADFHSGEKVTVDAERDVRLNLVALKVELAKPKTSDSAEEIMRQVAENQDRAREARKSYVYDMNVFVRLKHANGEIAREETRDYVVTPGAQNAERELSKVDGKIFNGKDVATYQEAAYRTKESDIDGAITDSFARTVLWKKGGFGPSLEWFPIAKDGVGGYEFTLEAEENYRDRDVFRITYKARDKEDCWAGEILVDRNELQPVLLTSEWACKIPTAVKIMLGTNVQHVGAKISYERFEKDIWFPVRCGGEMKLRVLFLYARTIAFSASNAGFRKADVQSSIAFAGEGK